MDDKRRRERRYTERRVQRRLGTLNATSVLLHLSARLHAIEIGGQVEDFLRGRPDLVAVLVPEVLAHALHATGRIATRSDIEFLINEMRLVEFGSHLLDGTSGGARRFLTAIGYLQWSFQSPLAPMDIARSTATYGRIEDDSFISTFIQEYGISPRTFSTGAILFHHYGLTRRVRGVLPNVPLQLNEYGRFAYEGFVEALSATSTELREHVESRAKRPDNTYLQSHDWRAAVRYPILKAGPGRRVLLGTTYLRELLQSAPSLIHSPTAGSRGAYERCFERYVVAVAAEIGPVVSEAELRKLLPEGSKLVDATLLTRSGAVLIDAKAAFSHPLLRTDPTEISARRSLKSTIKKGLEQVEACSRAVRAARSQGVAAFDALPPVPKIARLIVTPMNLLLGPRAGVGSTLDLLLPENAEDLPTFVVDVQDFEHLVVASKQSSSDIVDILYKCYDLEKDPATTSFNFRDYLRAILELPTTLITEVNFALEDVSRAIRGGP